MAKENIRRAGQEVFALLCEQDPQQAPGLFARLCALCALEALDFLPAVDGGFGPLPVWPKDSPCPEPLLQALCQRLPQLFPPDAPPLRAEWFLAHGPAARLRRLFGSVPAREVYGLSARLWEACTELPRRQSFAGLRRQQHHTGKNAAYATQLFTPGWLGCFLLENAIGRMVGRTTDMKYYMTESDREEPPLTDCLSLTVLDPCAGGGELLCRAFDLLYPRLVEGGLTPDRAVRHLLERTLFGLDLDKNALCVCRLELLLRGRSRDPLLFEREIHPRLAVVEYADHRPCGQGSLLAAGLENFDQLAADARQILSGQYDIVATNPPYMGLRGMPPQLRSFLRSHYPAGRTDLYAAFSLRCLQLAKQDGCVALLVPQGWLTLGSFARLREFYAQYHMPVLLRLGAHAFPGVAGEVVQTAAFVVRKRQSDLPTALCDLSQWPDSASKEAAFLSGAPRSLVRHPLALQNLPEGCRPLGHTARICQGLATGNNDRFVRLWFEVDPGDIARGCADRVQAAQSGKRWFPYNKGGGFRRWWGNDLYVVDFADDGAAIRAQTAPNGRPRARVQNSDHYFRPGVTYSFVGSKNFSARIAPPGFIFDVGGSTAFPADGNCLTLAALLNSGAARSWLLRRNPTVNFQVGDLAALPCPRLGNLAPEVERLAALCVDIARRRWEESEPAPAFVRHPWAAQKEESLAAAALLWQRRFAREEEQLCAAQRRLDEIFAGLLNTEPAPAEHRPAPPDMAEECRRFLSWCAGRVLGRFGSREPTDCLSLGTGRDSLSSQVEGLLADLWGADRLEETLDFLAARLNWRGDPHAALAEYFRGNFWAHHNKLYQNRPVYWLCPHKEQPVLLYYHALNAATAKKLARLQKSRITPPLKKAQSLWQALDKNRGIAAHMLQAADLGLVKLPPALQRKQKERKNPL